METPKLFEKYKCNGFYKRIYDGVSLDLKGGEEVVEKTYYEYVKKEFRGVVVGSKELLIEAFLCAEFTDSYDTGMGTMPSREWVSKNPKKVVECAIVYYANNKKHLVPINDVEEV